jgi:hypothetical protein
MKIKKGDRFVCIKKVTMDTKEVAYKKGYVYFSDLDYCITNIELNQEHRWFSYTEETKKHFLKIKQ